MKVSRLKLFAAFFICWLAAQPAVAQTEKPKTAGEEKAEKILQQGIQALGGDRYLKIQSVIGRGFFTEYQDGISGIPIKFVDYILYPDKERTEFNGGGARIIQTNFGGRGWVFDGAAKTIKDQNDQQLEDFRIAMRVGVENLLHGWWRAQGATLSYAGRREAGLARRNETVKLTYPDGFWIEYEFSAVENMPAKVIYARKRKKPDSDEKEDITEEDRLYKFVSLEGAQAPLVIDHFRGGVQTSRINYESYEFNKTIPDSLWTKPSDIKKVK
jgi:hypothetical protein